MFPNVKPTSWKATFTINIYLNRLRYCTMYLHHADEYSWNNDSDSIFFFFVTLLFCVLSESYQTYQTGPRLPTRDVAATWQCGPGFDSRTRASLCKAIYEHFLLFASKDMVSALHCRCRNSLLAVCHCWMHHEPFLRWRYEEERRLWSIQHWGGMI